MKILKSLSVIVLFASLLGTVAFRASTTVKRTDCTGTLFVFNSTTNGVNEFDPTKYVAPPAGFQPEELPAETTSCPEAEVVCAICTPSNLIYPTPNPSNPSFAGKPKVDAGNLKSAIQAALANTALDGQAQTFGSDVIIVYLKRAQ